MPNIEAFDYTIVSNFEAGWLMPRQPIKHAFNYPYTFETSTAAGPAGPAPLSNIAPWP